LNTLISSSTITIFVDYSQDRKYRYGYRKEWNKNKRNATFILMNPSKGTELKLDNTIVNINNYCVDNDFGSLTILNLFPLMATSPKELSGRLKEKSSENNQYIKTTLDKTKDIFIAWGYEKKYLRKKKEIEQILNLNNNKSKKIKCWSHNGKYPKHLRVMSEDWTVIDYKFKHIETK